MGYWPRRMKVRRHSFAVNLGRKLTLCRCYHTVVKAYQINPTQRQQKNIYRESHYINHISAPHDPIGFGGSYTNAVIRAGHMMEIL